MKTLIKIWKRWRLNRANEKHAAAKGRYRVLSAIPYHLSDQYAIGRLADAAASAAKYEERVERMMREQ